MNARQSTRAERDQPAALRASEVARAVWWQAQQPAPARRCIHCHAEAPAHLEEGESPPCGCP